MKTKGFTLIELMGVVILIGILALITVPVINGVIQSSRESALKTQKALIEKAGKSWAIEHVVELNELDVWCITVNSLIRMGYLEGQEVIDPTTNETLEGSVKISYTNNNYDVSFISSTNGAGCTNEIDE